MGEAEGWETLEAEDQRGNCRVASGNAGMNDKDKSQMQMQKGARRVGPYHLTCL